MKTTNSKSDEQLLIEARVFATNILVSLPQSIEAAALTLKSKLPFKATSLREVLIHRIAELSMAAVDLYECNKLVPAFVITRAVIETVGMTYYLYKKIAEFVQSKDVEKLNEFLDRAMLGSRDKSTPLESYNVLTVVDHLDNKFTGFREMYDHLCEFTHPNWSGVLGSYSKPDQKTLKICLGKNYRRPPLFIGLIPLTQSLKIFEHYYNELSESLKQMNDYFENVE